MAYNGIDVSRWQGTIDWGKVKASGVDTDVSIYDYPAIIKKNHLNGF